MSTHNQEKKKEIVACLYCRKNHKKCDGHRPCFHCIRNKTECVENVKRKAVGRPSKSLKLAEENTKKFKKVNILAKQPISNNLTCDNCNYDILAGSAYCINCGNTFLNENEKLKLELSKMREKNRELTNFIEMNMLSTSSQLWMMCKLNFPKEGEAITYPISSYVTDVSPILLNLLGYNNLNNLYYPDLLPSIHKNPIDFKNENITIEFVEGLSTPKMVFIDNIYLRHKEGYFVNFVTETNIYFDSENGLPSFRILKVNQISSLHVEEKDLPRRLSPLAFHFYCNSSLDLPEFIKRYTNYTPYDYNQNIFSSTCSGVASNMEDINFLNNFSYDNLFFETNNNLLENENLFTLF